MQWQRNPWSEGERSDRHHILVCSCTGMKTLAKHLRIRSDLDHQCFSSFLALPICSSNSFFSPCNFANCFSMSFLCHASAAEAVPQQCSVFDRFAFASPVPCSVLSWAAPVPACIVVSWAEPEPACSVMSWPKTEQTCSVSC